METKYDLLPGETVLWSGRSQRFSPTVVDLIPFAFGAIFLGGGVLTFLNAASRSGAPSILPLLFAGLGVTLAWGQVLIHLVAQRSTTYLLTNRRVIAVSTRPRYRELSEYLVRLEPPVVRLGPDGSGTIGFGAADALTHRLSKSFQKGSPQSDVFIELRAIADAARVRDLIANARERPS